MDPQAFQADASPFAPSKSSSNDSPRSIPSEMRSRSPPPESAESAPNKSPTWKGRHRSHSGFWSNVSSTPPTPKSEMSNNELGNRQADDSSTYQEVPVVNASDTARRRKSKSSGSRMSMFFRSPSTISSGHGLQQGPDQASASRSVRNGGVDLLADGADIGTWEQMPDEAGGDVLSPSDGRSPAEEEEQSVLMDLWEGIGEFGQFCFNSTRAHSSLQNTDSVPQDGTLLLRRGLIQIRQNGPATSISILPDPNPSSFGHRPGAPFFVSWPLKARFASNRL